MWNFIWRNIEKTSRTANNKWNRKYFLAIPQYIESSVECQFTLKELRYTVLWMNICPITRGVYALSYNFQRAQRLWLWQNCWKNEDSTSRYIKIEDTNTGMWIKCLFYSSLKIVKSVIGVTKLWIMMFKYVVLIPFIAWL